MVKGNHPLSVILPIVVFFVVFYPKEALTGGSKGCEEGASLLRAEWGRKCRQKMEDDYPMQVETLLICFASPPLICHGRWKLEFCAKMFSRPLSHTLMAQKITDITFRMLFL